ncbi:MAG: hypothetical protein LBS09_08910 [Bacteroidales bacterium]|nr:hypothetical protein [Bacteroidales bacterium]
MKKIIVYVKYSVVGGILWFILMWMPVTCSKDVLFAEGNFSGVGGSMARFAVAGDMLYTVDAGTLKQFNISDAAYPKYNEVRDIYIGNNIETVFPMDTLLYIGSQNGMYVYDISDPRFPDYVTVVKHIHSCDPVVVEGHYAYVTLNTISSWCGRNPNNVLHIYDVTDPVHPVQVGTVNLVGPKGLGADGNLLFVCDKGLKIFDISHPEQPESVKQIGDLADIDAAGYIRSAYDVIPADGLLILVADEGLFLFDYTDFEKGKDLKFLNKIEVKK